MFIFNIRCPHTFSHKVYLNCEFLSFLYTFFSIHASLSQTKTINTPARTQTHICFFVHAPWTHTHVNTYACARAHQHDLKWHTSRISWNQKIPNLIWSQSKQTSWAPSSSLSASLLIDSLLIDKLINWFILLVDLQDNCVRGMALRARISNMVTSQEYTQTDICDYSVIDNLHWGL